MKVTRRKFLNICLNTGAWLATSNITKLTAQEKLKESQYYLVKDNLQVQCIKCPYQCLIKNHQRGFCRVRENQGGKLYSITYANPCAVHVDPIEKKPFFHVLPGSQSYSIATVGCNLRCKFCQNWQISQSDPEDIKSVYLEPEDIVAGARQTKCLSIAYTYTEPTVFYEYCLDISKIAQGYGIKNVMHSNGYINPDPLRKLVKHLDAVNVDLKSFSDDYYQKVCQGDLTTVTNSLKIIKQELGVWLELTNLVVPTLNDYPDQIKMMCDWIVQELGQEVPLHFSRFYPTYKLSSLAPTPLSTLEKAYQIAKQAGLYFVYIGNVPGHKTENTYCPECSNILIERSGYVVIKNSIGKGVCSKCSRNIPGIWA
ncbi:MAG: AmmeMemoRadiSam system radical SAM enzyme [Candidatus Omnitrophota bacterium]